MRLTMQERKAVTKKVPQREAAEVLALSMRKVRRLLRRYEEEGDRG